MAVKENSNSPPPGWDGITPHPTYQHIVLQQSVTMLAYMDHSSPNATEKPVHTAGFWESFGSTSSKDLPILIGAATGAVGLLVIIMIAVVIWHCCQRNSNTDKAYSLESSSQGSSIVRPPASNIVHSDSVVFLGVKPQHIYETQVVESKNETEKGLTRSHSLPLRQPEEENKSGRKRPCSQPDGLPTPNGTAAQEEVQPGVQPVCNLLGLPIIPESMLKSCDHIQEVPALSQCSSYNALDEALYNHYYGSGSNMPLKTRSLPSWGHSKPRPLSTEDDLNELYAKVSFSKKRKNRMRNDSAAAIAATKSKTTYHTLPFAHKDTDSLVDNEAVVIYDERTAL